MILTTTNDSVDKKGKHDPSESFARWSVWANGNLISCKYSWAEVEADTRDVVSGKRKSAIERPKK